LIQGLSDIAIPLSDFAQLALPIDTVFVTENDVNALAFPAHPRAIVIFGRGYGFEFLTEVQWLQEKAIFYWGDIDTHGFAILSQFRSYLPTTKSLLMDVETFLSNRVHWTLESRPSAAKLTHLTAEEALLYSDLQHHRYGDRLRLEQEYVAFNALEMVLKKL
jgi:hypothetical protein